MNQLDREAFVAALLAGELSPTDPQVEARLRADPELRIMIDRIRDVEAAAVRAADEEREILAAARGHSGGPFAVRVAAAVQQVVVERQRARTRGWLAAAAVLVAAVALGWFLLLRKPAEPSDISLGGDSGLEPSGVVHDVYPAFRWTEDLPPGGRFVLRIYADPAYTDSRYTSDTDLRYTSGTAKVTSPWTLTPGQESALPDEIWWEVEVPGGDGSLHRAHAVRRH